MITRILAFIIFFINAALIYTQPEEACTYHSDCGYWSIDRSGTSGNEVPSPVFIWQYVTTPVTAHMNDIIFSDTLNGWAVHNSNGALRTTNGGFTWDSISFNDTSFYTTYNGTYFINSNTGWAVGGSVQVRKTTNGGVSWFKQNSVAVAGVLNSIYFFDENTGIAIGRKTASFNSFMQRTTNGGTNWTEIVATTASNNELHDQFWFDANNGWISGRDVLLKTTNGGLNWSNLYANIPPTSNGANALLSIYFANLQTGWIGGSNIDKKNIYKTTNGGTNWVFQPNPVALYTYTQINDVKLLNQDSGWAVHGTPFSGAIMFTTNGGANWEIEEGSNYWFDCITYYQRIKAWCGSSNGRVWYTYLGPPVGISSNNGEVPEDFALLQNYPNPFNPSTTIKFEIPDRSVSHTRLIIYDMLGREIKALLDKELRAGIYEIEFDASAYPSGVYFYSLKSANFLETKKMILIK